MKFLNKILSPFNSKRKNFLINKEFQMRFIFYTSCISFIGVFILYFTNLFFFYKLRTEGLSLGLNSFHPYFYFIQEQKVLLHTLFLIFGFISLLFLFIAGLLMSHKIAGPIYRTKQNIKLIIEQDSYPTKIKFKFRQGDFFQDLGPDLDQLVEFYENKIKSLSSKDE